MKTILTLLLTLNILSPFGNTPVNNLGNVDSGHFSYNYSYFIDYFESSQTAVAGVYEYERDYPTYYGIKVNIIFNDPIKYAKVMFTLSTPLSNAGNVYWDYIGENAYVYRSSNTVYYAECRNCTMATIVFLISYQDLKSGYGYNRVSFESVLLANNTWIDYGNQYCDIRGAQISGGTSSYVIDTNPDYTTQLNTLLSQTDGIENYLVQIWNSTINNGQYITGISTTLGTVRDTLNAINNKLDNISNIKWNLINTTYKGYTTDYQNFNTDTYGYHDAGWYVLETPNFSSSVSNGIYKLTIPLGVGSTSFNNITLAQYWSDNWRTFVPDTYLYYPSRNYIVVYFTVNETYHQWPQSNYPLGIYFDKQMYKYSDYQFKLEYILQTDENYWELYNVMKTQKYNSYVENSLSRIISILGSTDITSTDSQNKQDIDNWYNNLLQDINLPNIPTQPSKLPFIQHLFQVYNEVINIPGLDIFKWFLGVQAIVLLFGVIIR